jgi:glutaredoxin 3
MFCPYCVRAVSLLEEKGVDFTEIDAGADPSLRREMMQRSGRSTFPQIFVGDRHIGGCDDLLTLDREGKFDPLLVEA